MKYKNRKHSRVYITASLISVMVVLVIIYPSNEKLHAHGPMNAGHEELHCVDCHKPAKGTLRQQLQANVKFMFWLRPQIATIGFEKVTNKQCLDCHQRETDNHPIYRFIEPKFAKVRGLLQPQNCSSCHLEHSAKRVTIKNGFCQHCHKKLSIKKDVLSTTHVSLISDKKWQTCLGCHDYHGNHLMTINKNINTIFSEKTINNYFSGTGSLYSKDKKYKTRKPL